MGTGFIHTRGAADIYGHLHTSTGYSVHIRISYSARGHPGAKISKWNGMAVFCIFCVYQYTDINQHFTHSPFAIRHSLFGFVVVGFCFPTLVALDTSCTLWDTGLRSTHQLALLVPTIVSHHASCIEDSISAPVHSVRHLGRLRC